MMHHSHSHMALLTAICFLAIACAEAPTGTTPEGLAPNFEKGGQGKGGGKGDGQGTAVEFLGSLSLFTGAPPDYTSASQNVKGTNTKNRIGIDDAPFQLTLAFSDEDLEDCVRVQGGTATDLDRLAKLQKAVPQPLDGLLGIFVVKKNFADNQESETGVVVNFTFIDEAGDVGQPGDEFFLTTGKGRNLLSEAAEQTRVAKTGGFVRINRNGDSKDAVVCPGILDYEFTVSK